MCGVPYHAADGYIARLLRKGYKVAICDQMEAPQKGVKLVKREVTRVITPGTVTDTNVLSPGENNFLLAISEQDGQLGCAFLDISTGELRASQFAGNDRWNRLSLDVEHFAPREVLFPDRAKDEMGRFNSGIAKTPLDDWLFDADYAARILHEQFGIATLDGFGLAGKSAAIAASGAMIHYVRQTQKTTLDHITGMTYSESADYLVLDAATIPILNCSSHRPHPATIRKILCSASSIEPGPAWLPACCAIGWSGPQLLELKSSHVSTRLLSFRALPFSWRRRAPHLKVCSIWNVCSARSLWELRAHGS